MVVALVLVRHGLHLDSEQLHLRGMTGSGLRLGLVLALFSFVGFESATTLGSEARDPLKTIPRAVIQSSLLAGAIFIVCAYTEVLGFRIAGQDLGNSQAPMQILAAVAGAPFLGVLINIGVLVSLFAGTLACVTAAARVLLLMAHNGLAHARCASPTRATKRRAAPSSLRVSLPASQLRCWRRAARAGWTFTDGWAPWQRTASSSPTRWLPPPFLPICAGTVRSAPDRQ